MELGLLVERIICITIGYIFGMIQTAVFYGRLKGVDIRKVGSGNAGTTNTLRVLGPKAGGIVLLGDMLKFIARSVIEVYGEVVESRGAVGPRLDVFVTSLDGGEPVVIGETTGLADLVVGEANVHAAAADLAVEVDGDIEQARCPVVGVEVGDDLDVADISAWHGV